jgi:hypothetical protein
MWVSKKARSAGLARSDPGRAREPARVRIWVVDDLIRLERSSDGGNFSGKLAIAAMRALGLGA